MRTLRPIAASRFFLWPEKRTRLGLQFEPLEKQWSLWLGPTDGIVGRRPELPPEGQPGGVSRPTRSEYSQWPPV